MVAAWAKQSQNTVSLEKFPSAEAFLFQYEEEKTFDILFLDIEMGAINGVDLAKKIREENQTIQIVFVTGFPDFMAAGYDVSALHYLLKPIEKAKLFAVLDRAVLHLAREEKSVVFSANGGSRRVLLKDIVWVEVVAHLCVVTTVNDTFNIRSTISDVEKLFLDGFIRCHRSYLVGIRHIKAILKTEIVLDSGEKIPLSRSHYHTVNQAFIRYFRGE